MCLLEEMIDQKTKITICISAYNSERFLRQTMDCVLQQTFTDFEVLCIDDASTDNTVTIFKEYVEKDSRVKLFVHEKNYGLSVSRNESITLAKGEYIVFIDADDLAPIDWLETVIKKAEASDADMVIWDYYPFYEETELKNIKKLKSTLEDFKSIGYSFSYRINKAGFAITLACNHKNKKNSNNSP